MTITNGYIDLPIYKLRFFDGDTTDHEDDPSLERVIEATSRAIDNITGRRFYAADETRYYTATDTTEIQVDDLLSVTTLKTDENGDRTYEYTWATTDYDLMPYNAALKGWPYQWIEISVFPDYYFPLTRKGVEIAGSWGFSSATPADIVEACLLGSHRYMKRTSTPLGVSASAALGEMRLVVSQLRGDPDIMGLLSPYIQRL